MTYEGKVGELLLPNLMFPLKFDAKQAEWSSNVNEY
jgi:hypothetical protein